MKRLIVALALAIAAIIPAAAPAAASSYSTTAENRMASLIIAEHKRVCGTTLLRVRQHNNLDRWRARDMFVNGYFGHDIPSGGHYYDYFRRYGIEDWVSPYASEILAWNRYSGDTDYTAATRAFNQYMNSSPHRRAIQNCAYNTFGVGAYSGNEKRMFATTFSKQPIEKVIKFTYARTGPGFGYTAKFRAEVGMNQFVFKHRYDTRGRRWDYGAFRHVGWGYVPDYKTR